VNSAHVKLLMHPRVVDLVNTKWERFAARVFQRRFISTLCYLLIFMLTTILGQTRYEVVSAYQLTTLCVLLCGRADISLFSVCG
jgi:hypothetical protein